MNHNKSYRKLGRRSDHRLAMMKNMTISLVNAERIETTVTRAKELRKFVEKVITLGKKYNNFNLENNDERAKAIHLRRQAFAFLRNEEAVAKVFKEIAPKYMDRNGGYTRIIKTDVRRGDSAELAIIELV
ncbi:ribosomal protein L17 [Leptotrichia sp. oral taxon 215 str. W9775]|jgi:ribosomal protein L17|uniref:50S ribosomal protein L17 n=1 Tax=Leptotrichia sp. oral taxon 215 TaxID=712359 RepID=UPI0003ADB34F|nr:50S ribosomal protein L17 [Leptotrichia sp. oral taxon 215]ERK67734.1 ribosomal protein L17 [Leptotrichia sp. oral taxon 215 str. W9775]MBF1333465.1 50S ribosomal protein L17 [Leptotrichia sp.]MBF1335862.1 50S ribosomal protein L17 [Leptotrichia sp.]